MKNFSRIFSTRRTVLLWAAAVAVAVGGGTAAVAVAASGPDPDVLTQDDVRNQLAVDGSASPSSSASTSAAPTPSDGRAARSDTPGGWVQVVCSGGTVYLHSWSPKPGYRADHVVRGPGRTVSLEFESDTADDVTVTVSCGADGRPQVRAVADPDDHGGDDRGGDDHGGDDRGGDDHGGDDRGRGGDDNRGRDHPEDD